MVALRLHADDLDDSCPVLERGTVGDLPTSARVECRAREKDGARAARDDTISVSNSSRSGRS